MRKSISTCIGLLLISSPVILSETLNVAGTWQVTAQSSLYGINSTANGLISQVGSDLRGVFSMSGTPCASSGSFTGSISGNTMTLNVNENGQTVVLSGTVTADGNSARGSYTAPEGGCTSGDRGSWSALRLSSTKLPYVESVTSGAFLAGPARDGLATIFGASLADAPKQASTLPLPGFLGSTQVILCSSPVTTFESCRVAPLLYVSPTQINFYVPQDNRIAPSDFTNLYVNVLFHGSASADIGTPGQPSYPFYRYWPSIFAQGYDCNIDPAAHDDSLCGLSATSRGPLQVQRGAITDQQGKLITSQNPARLGQYYSMYLTGLGMDAGQKTLDMIRTQALMVYSQLPSKAGPPYVGKMTAMPDWAGASSFVGLQQVNFKLPEQMWDKGLPCGDQRYEIGIGFSTGSKSDTHGFRLPVLIRAGEMPCGQ